MDRNCLTQNFVYIFHITSRSGPSILGNKNIRSLCGHATRTRFTSIHYNLSLRLFRLFSACHVYLIASLLLNSNINAYTDGFLNRHYKYFRVKKTFQISNLNKSLIAGNHVYLNCSAFHTSYIIHHTSYIIHHTSYIIHHTSYIIHHTSYIIHHTSYIIHHTSYIIHHTSYIIHHTSYIIHHTSYIIHHTSYIIHHTSYIIHHTSYIIHHTSYIIHHTSYIIHHTS